MLFKLSLLMLGVWLLGVSILDLGDVVHVLLLAGLMLLLISFLRARDEAARRATNVPSPKP